ncbi:MAG: hypothetical protein ACTS22_00155 [Phycisphaerales bacterium]
MPSEESHHDIERLTRQVEALVAERNRLFGELGVADADGLIAMIRSLESQLVALYRDREAERHAEADTIVRLLDRVRTLAGELGDEHPHHRDNSA